MMRSLQAPQQFIDEEKKGAYTLQRGMKEGHPGA